MDKVTHPSPHTARHTLALLPGLISGYKEGKDAEEPQAACRRIFILFYYGPLPGQRLCSCLVFSLLLVTAFLSVHLIPSSETFTSPLVFLLMSLFSTHSSLFTLPPHRTHSLLTVRLILPFSSTLPVALSHTALTVFPFHTETQFPSLFSV